MRCDVIREMRSKLVWFWSSGSSFRGRGVPQKGCGKTGNYALVTFFYQNI